MPKTDGKLKDGRTLPRGKPAYSVNAYQRLYRRWKTAEKAKKRLLSQYAKARTTAVYYKWKVKEIIDCFNID